MNSAISEETIKTNDGYVTVKEIAGERRLVEISSNKDVYSPDSEYYTKYTFELIRKIAEVKGAAWVCNEISREENPKYLDASISALMMGHLIKEEINGKRILDFGCGCGASSIILARHFPNSEITGLEYMKEYIDVALMRKQYYQMQNVSFQTMPSSGELPAKLGRFDFIVMCGVYEHLLPDERETLFPELFRTLNYDGVMFINHTPHRYFPLEMHTTEGLPLINFLPDKLTERIVKKYSVRVSKKASWKDLLRDGIRGGTKSEMINILKRNGHSVEVMKPIAEDISDEIDLWYLSHGEHGKIQAKKRLRTLLKLFKSATRIELTPYISIAIKRKDNQK